MVSENRITFRIIHQITRQIKYKQKNANYTRVKNKINNNI